MKNYQKAVALKKPRAETMTTIEAAANTNCPTLNPKPLTFPGPPNISFISPLKKETFLPFHSMSRDPFLKKKKQRIFLALLIVVSIKIIRWSFWSNWRIFLVNAAANNSWWATALYREAIEKELVARDQDLLFHGFWFWLAVKDLYS